MRGQKTSTGIIKAHLAMTEGILSYCETILNSVSIERSLLFQAFVIHVYAEVFFCGTYPPV